MPGTDDAWQPGKLIDGRYHLMALAGAGGMGLVYRARHLQWGVDLAVKRPRLDAGLNAGQIEKFMREAETWVSVGLHPNVCGCHYVRKIDDVPTVFAEYVAGGSLQRWITDRVLYQGPVTEATLRALDVAIQLAWGLGHAHDRGLVHQDVKPANVLLDSTSLEGDLLVKVTDFGLARARASLLTGAGAIPVDDRADVSVLVGAAGMTPAYASPEQRAGKALSRRTDIYSYAASVLEMFVGRRTWRQGPDARAALARCLSGGITDLPMPPTLAELLSRCLAPDPSARPGSLAEVAATLGEVYREVAGRRYPRAMPVAAELRADELNNRALSMLDLERLTEAREMFAAALRTDPQHLVARYNAGLLRWRSGAVTDEDLVAEFEGVRSDAGDPWQARHLLAEIQLERGDVEAARALVAGLEEKPEVRETIELLRSGLLPNARTLGSTEMPWWTDDVYQEMRYSKDGGSYGAEIPIRIAASGRIALTGDLDGTIRVWDLRDGSRPLMLHGHTRSLRDIDVTPDARMAVSFSDDNTIRVWDLRTGSCVQVIATAHLDGLWSSVRISPDGRLVLWGGDGLVQLRDLATGHHQVLHDGEFGGQITLSDDGRRAMFAADGKLHLFELSRGRGRELLVFEADAGILSMVLSPGAYFAVIGTNSGRVLRVCELTQGRLVRAIAGADSASSLSLSADGRYALSGASDKTVRFWDLVNGQCVRTFKAAHEDFVEAVWMSGDARFGLSVGQDNAIRHWLLPAGHPAPYQLSQPRVHAELTELNAQMEAHVRDAEQALAAEDFRSALDALTKAREVPGYEQAPRVLSVWRELGRSTTRAGLRGAWEAMTVRTDGHPHLVDLSDDARIAVMGSFDGAIRIWSRDEGRITREIKAHAPKPPYERVGITGLCISGDGQRVLSSASDGFVNLWRAETGECLLALDTAPLVPTTIRFSVDEGQALVGVSDGSIGLWDLHTGRLLQKMAGHGNIPILPEDPPMLKALLAETKPQVECLSPSVDGRFAASVGSDGNLRLWQLDDGHCVRTFDGYRGANTVSLSTDGRFLLSIGNVDDRPIRLWDVETGACIRAFDVDAEHHPVTGVLTTDGRFAVSAGWDSTVRIWEVATGRCLRSLTGHQDGALAVALSPDGYFAVSAGQDFTMKLWELDWELAIADEGGSLPRTP
ncbi:protein kinase [Kitasatospora sp. NPDC127067]|uniref:protein kinase domain-containing protein n=1 Tax=Kitasatospora sp. NPDC127067 TaxID=3347126 RepID=UPI00364837FF